MEKIIELSKPITAHGEVVSTLHIQEPTLGALENIHISVTDKGAVQLNLGELQGLIANMANIPASSARQISLRDMPKLLEVVKDFFGDFLQIS